VWIFFAVLFGLLFFILILFVNNCGRYVYFYAKEEAYKGREAKTASQRAVAWCFYVGYKLFGKYLILTLPVLSTDSTPTREARLEKREAVHI